MPPNQINDQELQFKKRARRRLVGAIALVLLMITILPMILDDRAEQAPPQEIAITIPSQEGSDFTSKIVPVEPGTEQGGATQLPPMELPQPIAKPDAAESAPQKPVQAAETKTELPKPAAPETPVKKAETAPANTKPASNAASASSAAIQGFYVQIGVFSDAGNVKKLQDKLQTQGYRSYTEKLATDKGEKIRLRAGPFASRLEAESALAKIKDSGLSGMVVKSS